MLKKNEVYELLITDLGAEGEGVGRAAGFPLFVPGALPGEWVEARVTKAQARYGRGVLTRIFTPSPHRVAPACPAAGRCGGCPLLCMDYGAQLPFKTRKVAEALGRIGGFKDAAVAETLGMAQPYRYRNKACFPVRHQGVIRTGFFSARSHGVTPVEDCLLQQPSAGAALGLVRRFMARRGLTAYDEATHSGLVRHVLVRLGLATGEVMVCLVVNGHSLPGWRELAADLAQGLPGFATLCLAPNTARPPVILGETYQALWGPGVIRERLMGLEFEISPLSFFQINPKQTEVLYSHLLARAGLGPRDAAADAYCGVGTISLLLARQGKAVYGIEAVPEAVADARRSAARNGLGNVEFARGKVEEILPKLPPYQVLVLDPPRRGCAPEALAAARAAAPARILYVSCDPATLARDLKTLCAGGAYSLGHVQPVDCFPHTAHVETVAVLERRGAGV